MKLFDTPDLRDLLARLLPGLTIQAVASPSGQRVVYFCNPENADWIPDHTQWEEVVLKVACGDSPQTVSYIQREIQILSSLATPHYPRLIYSETFVQDPATEEPLSSKLFITIEERVQAEPLDQLRGNYISESAVLDLIKKLVIALQPLWESKPPLIHRDIKPQNILIRPDGEVVIIDLGIVRVEGVAGVTLTIGDFGPCTPKYASPEQARNDKLNISFKSDFFSLGTLCYELLAGFNPFDDGASDLYTVLHNVVTNKAKPLHDLGLCSAEFSNIIQKIMEKEPYKRFRRIEDLTAALEACPRR
jgi:eukaryotic-like serine/threonine-protein kinase